ncbi:MAG TPA: hypothetical protein VLL08_01360 [Kineosporiaceae bacterium]|nr:hypothetical protein [Kineosporiaceae bacterium]
MSEHLRDGPEEAGARRPRDSHRPEGTPDGSALIENLQRRAGNRAVAGLLAQPAAPVQRDPSGPWSPPGKGQESQYRLHLDPQIEAQIRAINAMNALSAPEHVLDGLLNLNLPPMPLPTGPLAPPSPAPASTPTAPRSPAPGTGLMGPRAGTGGDIWKAVLAEPALGPAIVALGDQAAARAKMEFDQLSTGTAVAVVSGSIVVGGAAITGLLANQDVRQWITATLNDKIIPVPKVPGLGVQLNLSGETMIVGLHLDVGKILPAALGFGPASQTTPLGAPPGAEPPIQRQAVAEPVPVPVPHCEHPPGGAVLQRDPLPGGIAGQTSAATGGAIGLQSIEGSFVLPAGKILSGGAARVVKTTDSSTISVQIRSDKITLSISNGIYIDAQWPVQNMRLHQVTHQLATNETTSDVRLADDEWGDGFIDMTGTAKANIAETVGAIISRTALDRARLRPPEPVLDTQHPPGPQGPPVATGGAFGDRLPAYDPLKDANPQETLAALVANLQAMPSDGAGDVSAQDISKISVGATIVVNSLFEQIEGGTGVRIPGGTPVSLEIDSGASVADLKGAGQGAAGVAAAAAIQAIHLSSGGIQVVKDGKPIATIDRLTISQGQVKIDHVSLLGEVADAAQTERSLRQIKGGMGGLAESGGIPFGFLLGFADAVNSGSDTPVFVPGLVKSLLEAKLQAAFTKLLAEHGRTAIPGVDLGSVLGVPGAPVSPK